MLKTLMIVVVSLVIAVPVAGQGPCVGGTLVSPIPSHETYLYDLDGNVVKIWHGSERPNSIAYMLPDSSIIRPCKRADPRNAGRIQRIDADDILVWDYRFGNDVRAQHHDIEPMPNGNVLLLAWEKKSVQEALDMGIVDATVDIWPSLIAEIEPDGATGGIIIWEWHIWDHLIQDVDPELPNYGVVVDHPELLDMNSVILGTDADWVHENSIDYNPELDQIVFSSRQTAEFYIIDHSTTTAQAAGHTGGDSGKGGDFLYRWGNPQVYGRGTEEDRYIDIAHGVNWIDEGLPGAGNVLIFDNGDAGYSSVYEVVPPLEPDGSYALESGAAYGPAIATWTYGGPGGFYGGGAQCGAYRLANGNTLITSTAEIRVFEVTVGGTTVWEHVNPIFFARAKRYCEVATSIPQSGQEASRPAYRFGPIHPNPFNPTTVIEFGLERAARVTLAVFDMRGRKVRTLLAGRSLTSGSYSESWDGRDDRGDTVGSGVYFARIGTPDSMTTAKLTLLK